MKAILMIMLILSSLNLLAAENELSLSGLRKLEYTEMLDLEDTLMTANNGSNQYGNCSLDLKYYGDSVEAYINQMSVYPLVVVVTKNKFLKI